MQTKATKLNEYASMTGLKINTKKTEVLRINSRSNNRIEISGMQLNKVNKYTYLGANVSNQGGGENPGGYSNYFLTECAARGLKRLPISKDFSHSKNGWIDSFFEIFANQDPFLRVFYLKNGWFYNFFFANFVKWDPPLRIFFFAQSGTHV